MAITPLPSPPLPTDSIPDFNTKAFDLVGGLHLFVTEANATAASVDAAVATAVAQAVTATTKASEALTSANNATLSASAAALSETNAGNSANSASTYANSASTSANNIVLSASAAAVSETNASIKASEALTSANNAALSAANALLYATQQFKASSTTSNTVSSGSKTFTATAGKGFTAGQYLSLASTVSPLNLMQGVVTAYNSTTGVLTVEVDYFQGASGPFTDWSIGLIGRRGTSGHRPTTIVTSNMNAVAGNDYVFDGVWTLTMPSVPIAEDIIGISNGSNVQGPVIDFGTVPVKRRVVGVVTMRNETDACVVKYTGNSTIGWGEI